MASTLKRKGSPSLEDSAAEPAKRRFAEDETAEEEEEATTSTPQSQPAPSAAPAAPANDRAARFAALKARAQTSRKSNLSETKHEASRASIDPSALTAITRKKNIAEHKLLKADIEAEGGDFERKRAWDWTVEESEKWDERLAEKAAKREGNKFSSYGDEAGKVYERQIRQNLAKDPEGERLSGYEAEKRKAIDRAVASGGLEIVEGMDGELIAVDRDGSFLSTADSATASFNEKKPTKQAVDRLVEDIKKAEEVRLQKRRARGRADAEDGGDVTYINEKNKQFNLKLARFYNKYTADIRESFERGTAI